MAKLYHVPLSPFCRKVRLSLAEKKIECELVEETYWENDQDFLRLLYERVNKKVTKQGFPDSANVKSGAKAIKYHLDYMAWLLDHRRWLAGDTMTLADFAAAAHLSSLDYIRDVDWNRSPVVKDWDAKIKSRPAFRSILADQVPGFPQPPHYADLDF
jgi:glutathione S-transferase